HDPGRVRLAPVRPECGAQLAPVRPVCGARLAPVRRCAVSDPNGPAPRRGPLRPRRPVRAPRAVPPDTGPAGSGDLFAHRRDGTRVSHLAAGETPYACSTLAQRYPRRPG